MKVLICKYGIAHTRKRCTCDRMNKYQMFRLKYVASSELKALPPGEYKVTVHPTGKSGRFELRPVKD